MEDISDALIAASIDPDVNTQLLSVSNQVAPRGYVQTAFCFPFDTNMDNIIEASTHFRAVLDSLATAYPFLAGTLTLEPKDNYDGGPTGCLQLEMRPDDRIPMLTAEATDDFEFSYMELIERKFPQNAFVGPRFEQFRSTTFGNTRTPVLEVVLFFIQEGLIVNIINHHSVMDGGSRKQLFDWLSAYSRGQADIAPVVMKQGCISNRVIELLKTNSFQDLLRLCPEYCYLPDKTGPCEPNILHGGMDTDDIEMDGRIFRFTDQKLKELRALIGADTVANSDVFSVVQQQPSVYMTLAALTWAHVCRARLETERNASVFNNEGEAALMTPVNWRDHALKDTDPHYFGNAVATVFTKARISQLLRACVTVSGLSELTQRINNAVKSVDEEYMCRRMALYKRVPDIRNLGLSFDLRNPQDYTFNTWRWFGGGTEWHIPGTLATTPDAIRRAAPAHKLGAIVILPAATPTSDQELYIELPTVSMDRLCQDREWMKWVDEVVI